MQAEAEGIVALHDDFRDQRTAQLCVWVVEEVRPILQQCYQLPRPLGGGIPLGIHKLFFVQLGLSELAGQLVAFGYKNVRINEAVLLEEGQRLILTGEFGYFLLRETMSSLQSNLRLRIVWRVSSICSRMGRL